MRSLAARGLPALALLVVLVALAAAGGAAQDDAPAETMRIELEPDGNASWTVTMRFQLESSNETDGFDRMASEFEAGESDVLTVGPYEEAARQASRSTGRSMEIVNVSRNAWRSNGTGRLELSFTWTSFANREADRMLLGDVFHTSTGTWLPRLAEGQELVVEFPEEYDIVDSSHRLENRAFDIHGPTSFEPGSPSATLVRGRTPTTTTVTTTTTGGPSTNDLTTTITTEPPVGSSWEMVGVGALVLLVGTLALLVERRRRSGGGPVPAGDGDDGRPGGAAVAESDSANAGPGAEQEPEAVGEEVLLSDDERVLRLLHQNDGRMKQARIVEETGWSNAKVSQLLSEMADGDQVDKLRIGRENLISLPGESPGDGE